MKEKLKDIKKLYEYLRLIGVSVNTIVHPEVLSCEESKVHYDSMGYDEKDYGLCKNIFIRDKKGKNFWLIIVDYRKRIDMGELKEVLKTSKRLGMATSNDLLDILGVESGSVSLFSVINDTDRRVKVIMDRSLMAKETLAFHPNYSGITSFINKDDAIKFLDTMGHEYDVLDVPTIVEETSMEESMFKGLVYHS